MRCCISLYLTYWAGRIAGGFHEPSMIDGGVSFGQYSRNIGMNFALGAGNQLASLSLPGESACKYRSTDPSAFVTNLLRPLSVYRVGVHVQGIDLITQRCFMSKFGSTVPGGGVYGLP